MVSGWSVPKDATEQVFWSVSIAMLLATTSLVKLLVADATVCQTPKTTVATAKVHIILYDDDVQQSASSYGNFQLLIHRSDKKCVRRLS